MKAGSAAASLRTASFDSSRHSTEIQRVPRRGIPFQYAKEVSGNGIRADHVHEPIAGREEDAATLNRDLVGLYREQAGCQLSHTLVATDGSGKSAA